ncbi:hypothetical protein ACJMK2_023949 [Sinanodonta woodiana]|uniref:Uncharacterized protein n=1 Tax=Sinanodonta woodiana TaxID=1069815 RepID=A0ABD3T5T8_SINWO
MGSKLSHCIPKWFKKADGKSKNQVQGIVVVESIEKCQPLPQREEEGILEKICSKREVITDSYVDDKTEEFAKTEDKEILSIKCVSSSDRKTHNPLFETKVKRLRPNSMKGSRKVTSQTSYEIDMNRSDVDTSVAGWSRYMDENVRSPATDNVNRAPPKPPDRRNRPKAAKGCRLSLSNRDETAQFESSPVNTRDRRLRPKAAKGYRTPMSITQHVQENGSLVSDVSVAFHAWPAKVTRPHLTVTAVKSAEDKILDQWVDRQLLGPKQEDN